MFVENMGGLGVYPFFPCPTLIRYVQNPYVAVRKIAVATQSKLVNIQVSPLTVLTSFHVILYHMLLQVINACMPQVLCGVCWLWLLVFGFTALYMITLPLYKRRD